MKYSVRSTLILFLFLALVACDDDQEDTPFNAVGLEIHDAHSLQGQTELNGSTVFYHVNGELTNVYQVKVAIDGKVLEAKVAYDQESIEFDGHNTKLSETQKTALLSASNQLFLYVNQQEGNVSLAEYSLIRLMEYWSRSPVDYVYGKRAIVSDVQPSEVTNERIGNEGITCIRRNTYVNAEYDQGNNGTRFSTVC